MSTSGWIGVDLDGTLAEYHGPTPGFPVGPPVPVMLDRVKRWRAGGIAVRIMTARVWMDETGEERQKIEAWCQEHVGEVLPVTNQKDYGMVELWDDRAVRVVTNTGLCCCGREI